LPRTGLYPEGCHVILAPRVEDHGTKLCRTGTADIEGNGVRLLDSLMVYSTHIMAAFVQIKRDLEHVASVVLHGGHFSRRTGKLRPDGQGKTPGRLAPRQKKFLAGRDLLSQPPLRHHHPSRCPDPYT